MPARSTMPSYHHRTRSRSNSQEDRANADPCHACCPAGFRLYSGCGSSAPLVTNLSGRTVPGIRASVPHPLAGAHFRRLGPHPRVGQMDRDAARRSCPRWLTHPPTRPFACHIKQTAALDYRPTIQPSPDQERFVRNFTDARRHKCACAAHPIHAQLQWIPTRV